jgi:hypothetical protein
MANHWVIDARNKAIKKPGPPIVAIRAFFSFAYCEFFSSFAMISGAEMFTPHGPNSLVVKKLSVRLDQ